MAASCQHCPLSHSWTADYCCLQRKREVVEVAGWVVGCWLQITGCVHTNLRAKQAVPGSPRSALQHDRTVNLHCFIHAFTSTHVTECVSRRLVAQISQPEKRGNEQSGEKPRCLKPWKCISCVVAIKKKFLPSRRHELQFQASQQGKATTGSSWFRFLSCSVDCIIQCSNCRYDFWQGFRPKANPR